MLQGEQGTSVNDEAGIIPELQYSSIITVAMGDFHCIALTSDGRLFSWGSYMNGGLGLGDPLELPVGAPGGFSTLHGLESARAGLSASVPSTVVKPAEVRFDHGDKDKSKGKRFCISATAGERHSGALVFDLPPEVRSFLCLVYIRLIFISRSMKKNPLSIRDKHG